MQQILVAEYKRNKYRNTSTQTRDAHCVMSHFIAEAQMASSSGLCLVYDETQKTRGTKLDIQHHTPKGSYRDLWQVLVVFWKKTFQAGAKCCQNMLWTTSICQATWMARFHGSMYTRYIYLLSMYISTLAYIRCQYVQQNLPVSLMSCSTLHLFLPVLSHFSMACGLA